MTPPSRSHIRRCAKLLRTWLIASADDELGWADVQHALDVLSEYRATFSYPLTKVAMGLRAMVKAQTGQEKPAVAQRLKRMERILEKLVRMPAMDLTRMEDIGGCRAVLRTPGELDGVLRRIRARWEIARFRNYIAEPRSSGYRAIHVVVMRDGRSVEVQLRTVGQQEWSDAVEDFGRRYGLPLKDEEGPEAVLEYFRLAGEGIYREEYGAELDVEFMSRFGQARQALQEWMTRGGSEK